MACSNEKPCMKPILRWVHSAECKRWTGAERVTPSEPERDSVAPAVPENGALSAVEEMLAAPAPVVLTDEEQGAVNWLGTEGGWTLGQHPARTHHPPGRGRGRQAVTAAIATLKRARARVARGWTQGTLARDANGWGVGPDAKTAIEWCATGALGVGTSRAWWLTPPPPGAVSLLTRAIVARYRESIQDRSAARCIQSIQDWNDAPGRTQKQVLAAFDRAIKLARGKP